MCPSEENNGPPVVSREYILRCARQEGFSLCGVARCRPLPKQLSRLDHWLGRGYHSGLEYMARNRDKRADPAALVPGASTVIVCAVNYKNRAWNCFSGDRFPKIASYALARDYHLTVKEMLRSLLKRLQQAEPSVSGRCFTDSAPVFEKAWAVEAGLGWIGRNSLLITPGFGSYVLLGEIIINARADSYDLSFEGERCGECKECVTACPGKAIMAGRVINTGRCISRLTTEKTVGQKTGSLHGWLFGCDVCQGCCPYNISTPMHSLPEFDMVAEPEQLTAGFWESITQERFDEIFGQTPLARTGFEAIKARFSGMRKDCARKLSKP